MGTMGRLGVVLVVVGAAGCARPQSPMEACMSMGLGPSDPAWASCVMQQAQLAQERRNLMLQTGAMMMMNSTNAASGHSATYLGY